MVLPIVQCEDANVRNILSVIRTASDLGVLVALLSVMGLLLVIVRRQRYSREWNSSSSLSSLSSGTEQEEMNNQKFAKETKVTMPCKDKLRSTYGPGLYPRDDIVQKKGVSKKPITIQNRIGNSSWHERQGYYRHFNGDICTDLRKITNDSKVKDASVPRSVAMVDIIDVGTNACNECDIDAKVDVDAGVNTTIPIYTNVTTDRNPTVVKNKQTENCENTNRNGNDGLMTATTRIPVYKQVTSVRHLDGTGVIECSIPEYQEYVYHACSVPVTGAVSTGMTADTTIEIKK